MLIEVVTFDLAAGVDEATFLEADAAVQTEAAPFCDGFVRRTTARSEDGGWAVVTLWADRDAADRAATTIRSHPAGARLLALVEEATVERRCFTTLD